MSEFVTPDGRGSPSRSRLRGWGDRLPQNRTLAGVSYRGSTVLCGVDPATAPPPTRFSLLVILATALPAHVLLE